MVLNDLQARERFLFTLDWLHGIRQRHGRSLDARLIHVCLHDHAKLGDAFGAQEAVERLIRVTAHLREQLRTTDLVARIGGDFWVLAPYTPQDTLGDKIAEVVAIAARDGLDIVERDVRVYVLDEVLGSRPDIESVLEILGFVGDFTKSHKEFVANGTAPGGATRASPG